MAVDQTLDKILMASGPESATNDALPEIVNKAMTWQSTGAANWFAETTLDVGEVVYLVVGISADSQWDWFVWDADIQALPRYGLAETERAAKWQAERSMQEVNDLLLNVMGCAP